MFTCGQHNLCLFRKKGGPRQWSGRSSGWAGNLTDIMHPLQWRQNSEMIQHNRFVQIKSWKVLLAEHCDILATQTLTRQSSENLSLRSQLWVSPIHFLISLHEKLTYFNYLFPTVSQPVIQWDFQRTTFLILLKLRHLK